jgi:hypothetical protein
MLDLLQQVQGSLTRLRVGQALVIEQRFHELVPHGEHRVERGHWFLEDHGQLTSLQVAPGSFG